MVNSSKLIGLMAEKGVSREEMAATLGITTKTLRAKLERRRFNTDEMKILTDTLDIKDPVPIFFAE